MLKIALMQIDDAEETVWRVQADLQAFQVVTEYCILGTIEREREREYLVCHGDHEVMQMEWEIS